MRDEAWILARIAELQGLIDEAKEGYTKTGNVQMLMLCPLYQAEITGLREALGPTEVVKGGAG